MLKIINSTCTFLVFDKFGLSKEERAINDDDDDDDDDPPIDDDVTKLSEQVGSTGKFIIVVIAYFFCKGCVKNVVNI